MNQPSLNPAIIAMKNYSSAHSAGTLGLVATLRSTAYGRLTFSPFINGIGGKPRKDQSVDGANWDTIHSAAITLTGRTNPFVTPWTYNAWGIFNSFCNTGDSGSLPNRRETGPVNNVPLTFFKGNDPNMVAFFLNPTAQGMNLFEDLVALATHLQDANSDAQWTIIHDDLAAIVNGDINTDYARPIAPSILTQLRRPQPALRLAPCNRLMLRRLQPRWFSPNLKCPGWSSLSLKEVENVKVQRSLRANEVRYGTKAQFGL
jgi:hypothetical protein